MTANGPLVGKTTSARCHPVAPATLREGTPIIVMWEGPPDPQLVARVWGQGLRRELERRTREEESGPKL